MSTQHLRLGEASRAHGNVVVMDVLRAFTTAAYAFAAGAQRIVMVRDIESAFLLTKEYGDWLLMGEIDGRPIPGFDFSNSPVEIAAADLAGRTLVQRTTSGTQGVTAVNNARRMFCGSLVCASATARMLGREGDVSYVITEGDEDEAGAEFIEGVRMGTPPDLRSIRERIYRSRAGRQLLTDPSIGVPEDVDYACDIDKFDFAIVAEITELGVVAYPVPGDMAFISPSR